MTPFEWIMTGCLIVVALCLLSAITLIVLQKDILTRAVVADMVFYAMLAFYLIWTITHETFIAYEIALLAAVVGGVLPTLSMARIVSQGRR